MRVLRIDKERVDKEMIEEQEARRRAQKEIQILREENYRFQCQIEDFGRLKGNEKDLEYERNKNQQLKRERGGLREEISAIEEQLLVYQRSSDGSIQDSRRRVEELEYQLRAKDAFIEELREVSTE